ncbi:exodeoxyribonuclease V subunit beta [Arenimonas sp.]|uniref:exodeoxyribonuclease V subunit beta n=1 Tax=Arenimonas sp. TaxID=1872635 RepID=UPI0039E6C231
MTETPRTDDLGLSLPLRGVQWIEASAGTGKTFLLATLYSRLVVEAGWTVDRLLAVTFTEAATQELRERLRERLVLARDLAAGDAVAAAGDDAQRLTSMLVANAIEREGRAFLLRRLRLAVEAMDVAPIFTIHGFCRRALADHALEAGQSMVQREIVENETALHEEIATDFWRRCNADAAKTAGLRSLWKSPQALAKELRELLAIDALMPLAVPSTEDAAAGNAEAQAVSELLHAALTHIDDAWQAIATAIADGTMHGNKFRTNTAEKKWAALKAWLEGQGRDEVPEDVAYFAASSLKEKIKKGTAPASPLFDAIDRWLVAALRSREARQRARIALVHEARDYARDRLDAIKRERGLIGYDDMVHGVAAALEGPQAALFARRLRQQYGVALVDEFQDTDPRQWRIFRRLFAQADDRASEAPDLFGDDAPVLEAADAGRLRQRALFLIGDPKQAIYRFRGGDVHAYLEARGDADAWHALSYNHRSRPSAVAVVSALFGRSGPRAFAEDGIDYLRVLPGGRMADEDYRIADTVPAALEVAQLVGLQGTGIDEAREAATIACVARMHALLEEMIAGRVLRRRADGGWRKLGPGDIAVLVERNDEAERIRDALALAGIPCVAAGRRSLYETDEAADLRCLLHALLAPADEARLRAALATPLLGLDASAIRRFGEDEVERRLWNDRLQSWRARIERHGPLAAIDAACAENASRLLALLDGERRLTNYLQLGEELQAGSGARLGLRALLDELERRMAEADAQNDAELLRLESDAARVKILTLHKSKGLEFDLVFLPYAGIRAGSQKQGSLKLARYHDGNRSVAELFVDKASVAADKEDREQFAEKIRLIYVGLTRARLATWLAWGAVKDVERTPLAWLLHRGESAHRPDALTPEQIEAGLLRWQQWVADEGRPLAIRILPAADALPSQRLRFDAPAVTPDAAIGRRRFSRDWWVYSFSQLSREDDGAAHDEMGGARDEMPLPLPLSPSRFVGSRFGNTLHAALETVDFAAWREWSGELPPPGEFDKLVVAMDEQGFAGEANHREGLPLLTHLVGSTLNARLPEGVRLCEVPASQRRSELEFHLAFAAVAMPALLAMLHRHGVVADRQAFGLRQRIEGLMTGFIDLVYEHEGRFYVLDYKSNQLPDYAPIALRQSVRDNEYDLQYTIYTLALHRWLRFRLGVAYDYDRHMGGVRYLYCRGLDRAAPDHGIHALVLPRELIEELDALFAPAPGLLAERAG